jgi:hypothetical protein
MVADGTLGLLSRSLQNNTGYSNQINNSPDLAIKSPNQRKSSTSTNQHGYSNYSNSFTEANGANAGHGAATAYMPPENQITHQQTAYPTDTQYENYPDPTVTNNSLTYSAADPHAYLPYPTAPTDSVDAPLLAAFAAQAASQDAANNWPRPISQSQSQDSLINSGPQSSWQQWTSAMAGENLEPQDRYSASALMQLGGRDLTVTDAVGTTAPWADMTGAQAAVVGQDATSMTHANAGMRWPLNIFDMGHDASGA